MKAFMETVLPYTFFSMLLLGTFLAVGKNEPLSVRVRMGKRPEDAGVFIRRLAVYLGLFFLNILVVLHFLAWQSVLAAVILWTVNPVAAHLIARMEVLTGLELDPDQLPGEGEQEL